MSEQTFDVMSRLAIRVDKTIENEAQEAYPALKAIAPAAQAASASYQAADKAVQEATSRIQLDTTEAEAKLTSFGRSYDAARAVILAHAPHEQVGVAAGAFTTRDDLFKAADDVARLLEAHGQEDWAKQFAVVFRGELDSARVEWRELADGLDRVQKLKAARREAGDRLWELLVELRKVVKAVYGASSREYHALMLDRRQSSGTAPATDPAPTPAPVTPVVIS